MMKISPSNATPVQPLKTALSTAGNHESGTAIMNAGDMPIQLSDRAVVTTEIAQKYDVRNLSPRQMAKMSQELYDVGALSFRDHAMLSFQPDLALEPAPGQTLRPDTPKDFISEWEKQLDAAAKRDGIPRQAQDRHLLNLLYTLDAMHHESSSGSN